MKDTKERFGKRDGVLGYHLVQSFLPGEVTPKQAHEIGVEYAKKLFGDKYEILITTHLDKPHIHNHFILNSVSFIDGLKYHDGGKRNLDFLRKTSDEICLENNLSIVKEPNKSKHKTYNVIQLEKQGGKSVRSLIREDIDEAISKAINLPQFLSILKKMDYEARTTGKYLRVRPFGSNNFFRLYKLGKEYSEEQIIKRIQARTNPPLNAPDLPHLTQSKNIKVKSSYARYIRRHKRYKGFIASYLLYRNTLKRVQKNKYPYRPSLYVRDDVQKLRSYSEQAMLLVRYRIETMPQLQELKKSFNRDMKKLNNRRQEIRQELRHLTNDTEIAECQTEIESIEEQIKPIYRNIKLIDEIEARIPHLQEKVQREIEKTDKNPIIIERWDI